MPPIRGGHGEFHELARYEVRPEALDRCVAAIHEADANAAFPRMGGWDRIPAGAGPMLDG